MKPISLIKIVIVGDYSIFRTALRMLVETEKNLKVVAEVSKISEISNLPSIQQPDLILVDLPDEGDNSDLFPFLMQSSDNRPILILTGSNDSELYQKCLRLGINGLILKEKSADVLFKAIERVHKGEFWFDRSLMGQTIRQLVNEKQVLDENPRNTAHDGLTEREKQVVNLICKGLKNKDIADKLFITETTVRHHLTSIFEKLALTSRLELVVYAFRHKLVKIPAPSETNFGSEKGSNGSSNHKNILA